MRQEFKAEYCVRIKCQICCHCLWFFIEEERRRLVSVGKSNLEVCWASETCKHTWQLAERSWWGLEKSRLSGSISMSSETGLKGGYKSSVQLLVVECLYLNCAGCSFLMRWKTEVLTCCFKDIFFLIQFCISWCPSVLTKLLPIILSQILEEDFF